MQAWTLVGRSIELKDGDIVGYYSTDPEGIVRLLRKRDIPAQIIKFAVKSEAGDPFCVEFYVPAKHAENTASALQEIYDGDEEADLDLFQSELHCGVYSAELDAVVDLDDSSTKSGKRRTALYIASLKDLKKPGWKKRLEVIYEQ